MFIIFPHLRVNASGSFSGERGNVLAVGNYCYVAVCLAALVAAARLQLVFIESTISLLLEFF